MTEECNCLALKQIPSCPFKTSENMLFFFKISGVSALATYWPALESAGVLEGKVLDIQAMPLSASKKMISLLVGNFFPTCIFPFTREFVPAELGHAVPFSFAGGAPVSKHQVRSFPSDCPVMLGISTPYFRVLLT